MLSVIFVVSTLTFLRGDDFLKYFADERIYNSIEKVLKNRYPDEEIKTKCMVGEFRRREVADKFISLELLNDQEVLSKDVETYISEANTKCDSGLIAQVKRGFGSVWDSFSKLVRN